MTNPIPVFVISLLTISIGFSPAFATINGEVTEDDFGLTLNGAWVVAESADEYVLAFQPSSGDYSLGATATSTVSTSQYFFQRDTQTGVSSTANDIDFVLGDLAKHDLDYLLAVDGLSASTMRGHINDAEEHFQVDHSINFVEDASTSWTHGGNTDCVDLINEVESDVSWSTENAEVLIAFVDIDNMTAEIGGQTVDIFACTLGPFDANQRPTIVIANDSPDFDRTIMHELTHTYDMDHETATCSTQIPNVMAVACGMSGQYLKNWTPTQDTNMENRRTWY